MSFQRLLIQLESSSGMGWKSGLDRQAGVLEGHQLL